MLCSLTPFPYHNRLLASGGDDALAVDDSPLADLILCYCATIHQSYACPFTIAKVCLRIGRSTCLSMGCSRSGVTDVLEHANRAEQAITDPTGRVLRY